jgi:hypothetical protein
VTSIRCIVAAAWATYVTYVLKATYVVDIGSSALFMRVVGCWCGPLEFLEMLVILEGRFVAVCATAAFGDGRDSRPAASRTPLARVGAPTASRSRSWCRRRGCGLDAGGRLTDGSQVDAEQLRTPLQRRRDRPSQIRVVPSPHRDRLSNRCSRGIRNATDCDRTAAVTEATGPDCAPEGQPQCVGQQMGSNRPP